MSNKVLSESCPVCGGQLIVLFDDSWEEQERAKKEFRFKHWGCLITQRTKIVTVIRRIAEMMHTSFRKTTGIEEIMKELDEK